MLDTKNTAQTTLSTTYHFQFENYSFRVPRLFLCHSNTLDAEHVTGVISYGRLLHSVSSFQSLVSSTRISHRLSTFFPSETSVESLRYPASGMDSSTNGFLDHGEAATKPVIDVSPNVDLMKGVHVPQREDLQPSYVQTVDGSDTNVEAHGWYSGMSTLSPYTTFCAIDMEIDFSAPNSKQPWCDYWILWRNPVLRRLPKCIHCGLPGERWTRN
jgi:hypothetical protein